MKEKKAKLIIFSAPSGAGKTTIVKELLIQIPELEFSITATTREKRVHETHAKDYYFISTETFKEKVKNNEFLEWEEVYADQFYGTLKSEVQRIFDKGNIVIFDVDVYGGMNIKKQYKDQALSIFVQPPSIEILEQRLRDRSTETEESLKKRISKAQHELSFAPAFDKIIINDILEKAIEDAVSTIKSFISTNV